MISKKVMTKYYILSFLLHRIMAFYLKTIILAVERYLQLLLLEIESQGNKHIYLGETRIATRMKIEGDETHGYETVNTYFYHSDHLGSANIITDYEGAIYEHIEYTPYGELWEEQTSDVFDRIPFRFTGKILDTETALYYFGARYMDPRTSRWISADPAGASLINPNRKGFALVEGMNWYSYTSNNPVRYIDPSGMIIRDVTRGVLQQDSTNTLGSGGISGKEDIAGFGCVLTTFTRMANELSGKNFSVAKANETAMALGLYTKGNELSPQAGAALVNALVNDPTKTLVFAGSTDKNATGADLGSKLNEVENSSSEFFTTGRIHTTNAAGTDKYDHQVNINSGSVTSGDISDISNPFNFNMEDTSNTNRQSTSDTSRSNVLYRVDVFQIMDVSGLTE